MRSRIGRDRLAGIHVAHLVALGEELVDAPEHVVAQDHRDFQPRRQPHHFARAGHRIHAAGIGDHLDAALAQTRRNARHQRRKIARIAQLRVGLLLLLQNRHGDLGEIIERQVIDGPLLHQAHRRFQPVAPEALAVGDANHNVTSSGRTRGLWFCRHASSANVRTSRESTGSITASQWPRAAAYRASSQRS